MQTMPSVALARAAAFDILLRVERESSYASELLHAGTYENLSTSDHALATQLVMGVLRWRSALDQEITSASSQPLKKLDLEILIALRLAVYQFRHLDRIPHRAALHESVELVKRARKRSAAPFVNAVLRKIASQKPLAEAAKPDSPASLSETTAHPLWLVERWVEQYGFETAFAICEFDQVIPATSIRLRSPDAESRLLAAGIRLSPGHMLDSARRIDSGDIAKLGPFLKNSIAIQDEGSQLVAALAASASKEGSRILDCCAAPGGKTLAMADLNPTAHITAVDAHAHRARRMKELLPTVDAPGRIDIAVADARRLPLSSRFDRVLADVPCSGTGTLARNPEIKWRLRPEDLVDLHQRQVEILQSALAQVAPEGRLLYSTCSLEKDENEDVLQGVLRSNEDFRTVEIGRELERMKAEGKLLWPDLDSLTRGPYLRTIPGIHPCDGFFAALLEKR
jgi:16S rRNA (cytosine967-C5)-methyltransferase